MGRDRASRTLAARLVNSWVHTCTCLVPRQSLWLLIWELCHFLMLWACVQSGHVRTVEIWATKGDVRVLKALVNPSKFLIGITPSGIFSFLSRCWGWRVSDKVLTQQSGFLDMVEHGDTVLADRGFTITDDIALRRAKLVIPSFTKGKTQLSQKEVETSKQLSQVRIHVERIIGLLKNKYTILKGPLRTVVVKHKDDTDFARIDKLLVVCSALTNWGEPERAPH